MEDEVEHVKTIIACQDYARIGSMIVSPHLNSISSDSNNQGYDNVEKHQKWKIWADSMNEINSEDTNE